MIVISDTTAITNLYQIDLLLILKELYGQVLIPEAVYHELSILPAQKKLIDQQGWIKVCQVKDVELTNELLKEIHRGEAEAITLAKEKKSELLIIDESKGRLVAKRLGITITGILGILLIAKKKGIILSVKTYMDDLIEKANFHVSKGLYNRILRLANEI